MHAILHFAQAKLVQERLPTRIVFKIFGDMFRDQNVTAITAIHHPLGNVDASARDIRLFVQVGDFVDRATVNSHTDVKFGMIFQFLANFQRTQDRRFQTASKNERAAIACRQTHQLAFRRSETELLCSAHDLL